MNNDARKMVMITSGGKLAYVADGSADEMVLIEENLAEALSKADVVSVNVGELSEDGLSELRYSTSKLNERFSGEVFKNKGGEQ